MSLDIVKKNSNSPFLMQRSIVNQDGEGGVYEQGGYNPDLVYNNSTAAESIVSFGKTLSAGIMSRTAEDENNSNLAKEKRLEDRGKRLTTKMLNSNDDKAVKIEKRLGNIGSRIQDTSSKIKKYNEFVKPTIKSDITK